MAEQRLNVPAAAPHSKNQHVCVFGTVADDEIANGKAPQAGSQVVACAPDIGVAGE